MRRETRYRYYVEGETEKKLLDEFKKEKRLIVPGSIKVFNVVERRFTNAMITSIPGNTIAILVYDTDKKKTDILRDNIRRLKNCKNVVEVWCVMQVENLEDELVRSTDINRIEELTGSRSEKDFKRDFLRDKHLMSKLYNHKFDLGKMWSTKPGREYDDFSNEGRRIKQGGTP